jgi:hypothetical protein
VIEPHCWQNVIPGDEVIASRKPKDTHPGAYRAEDAAVHARSQKIITGNELQKRIR